MREYRFRGARVVVFPDRLIVQYPSRTNVSLSLGEGKPQFYLQSAPLWLGVDDESGALPVFSGDLVAEDDKFGAVLTEIVFRGEATAEVDGDDFVVFAKGTPRILEGADVLPCSAGDLAGVDRLTWACIDVVGNPHQPV